MYIIEFSEFQCTRIELVGKTNAYGDLYNCMNPTNKQNYNICTWSLKVNGIEDLLLYCVNT